MKLFPDDPKAAAWVLVLGAVSGVLWIGNITNIVSRPHPTPQGLRLTSASIEAVNASVTLGWNSNPEPDISGYRLYYGTASHNYTSTQAVGNVTTATLTSLSTGTTYFFAVTASNHAGMESPFSNEVSYLPAQPTPTPTPPTLYTISGKVAYCWGPGTSVPLQLTGTVNATTMTDSSGGYIFIGLPFGNYSLRPTPANYLPGVSGIDVADVLGIQSFIFGTHPDPCFAPAADVNASNSINTVDMIAVQRFSLGFITGVASTGKHLFNPSIRNYTGLNSNQVNQNFQIYVYGDVAFQFLQ